MEKKEVKPFWTYFRVIWKNRVRIFMINTIVAIITVIILLFVPKWYKSTAMVVLKSDNAQFSLTSAISQIVPFGLGGGDQNIQILYYIRLLNSRSISDSVIEKFDLMNVYEMEYRDICYKTLSANTMFVDNDDGSFSISCLYKNDAQKAADMANYYYQLLKRLSTKIDQSQAKAYREHLEKNYYYRKEKLEKLEEEFKNFQEETRLLNFEQQAQAAITSLAELEVEKIKLEIQRDYLQTITSEDNSKLIDAKKLLSAYQNKIQTFKTKNQYSNVPFNDLPKHGMQYLRYYRDIMINEKITEFLAVQYEQAKLDENKKTSSLYLLDAAKASDRKYKPKRLTYLIIICFFTFISTLLYYRIKEYLKENKKAIQDFLK